MTSDKNASAEITYAELRDELNLLKEELITIKAILHKQANILTSVTIKLKL